MASQLGQSKRHVCYYYDENIGNYYYGQHHPMKPHRIRMAHNLILNYGLYRYMEMYRPSPATFEDMTRYHGEEYIRFLKNVTVDNQDEYPKQTLRFKVHEDCPVFDGMYDFCQLSAGGSVTGAVKLNHQCTDIAINWGGGLHHAKKSEASGFCYVNDIVLAILELLKYHQRVLYIDIDIHHGDGVEEAFYTTDRVMTVSFHKYGEYFPGTGDLRDIGAGKGKYYAVNFPLRDGITDEAYESIFKPLITKVIETYCPSAIVLQCGADSLCGDRLGCFNLTLKGHGKCVEFVKNLNIPLLLLGGGGYTIRNVARCWTYETSVVLNQTVDDDIPYNDYFEYYTPDYKLHIKPHNMENCNSSDYLDKVKIRLFENLRQLPHVPSVQMQPIPEDLIPSAALLPAIEMEMTEMDTVIHSSGGGNNTEQRLSKRYCDRRIMNENELSDSEDEIGDHRRDIRSHKRVFHCNNKKSVKHKQQTEELFAKNATIAATNAMDTTCGTSVQSSNANITATTSSSSSTASTNNPATHITSTVSNKINGNNNQHHYVHQNGGAIKSNDQHSNRNGNSKHYSHSTTAATITSTSTTTTTSSSNQVKSSAEALAKMFAKDDTLTTSATISSPPPPSSASLTTTAGSSV